MNLVVNEGLSNVEIAAELGISIQTAKRHLFKVMEKTGYSTKLELAIRTHQKRLSDDQSGMGDVDFLATVQRYSRGLSKTQCEWLLEAIEMYAIRLRAGKFEPASVRDL